MYFFENLGRFGILPALIDADTGTVVTYEQLEKLVNVRTDEFRCSRQGLVFLEIKNDLHGLVNYLSALRAGHAIHLVESLSDEKTRRLIDLYRPNIVMAGADDVRWSDDLTHNLHANLAVLLSTSGSTGVPKFVKLSKANIQANAESIADYLSVKPGERAYCHLKPFYSYGMSVINSHLFVGATLVLTNKSITDPNFLVYIKKFSVNSLAGVPYTFEYLDGVSFDLAEYPDLNCLTQAGGRLEEGLVKKYANMCRILGRRFFVMYGQTEAAPRISYLPFDLVEKYPNSIGVAIPGGELFLVDGDRRRFDSANVDGELAYRGPNVMLGYASTPEELGTDETPDILYTGDIAKKTEDGVFVIVGRTSRFVKIFGLRLNLDQIQTDLRLRFPNAIVSGNDSVIVLGLGVAEYERRDDILLELTKSYHLPRSCFQCLVYKDFPLLPSGKYDYKRMLEDAVKPGNLSWYENIYRIFSEVLELNERHWVSVMEMYCEILAVNEVSDLDTFEGLGGDSLSYVALSIEMEQMFGKHLPIDWPKLSLKELNQIYENVR